MGAESVYDERRYTCGWHILKQLFADAPAGCMLYDSPVHIVAFDTVVCWNMSALSAHYLLPILIFYVVQHHDAVARSPTLLHFKLIIVQSMCVLCIYNWNLNQQFCHVIYVNFPKIYFANLIFFLTLFTFSFHCTYFRRLQWIKRSAIHSLEHIFYPSIAYLYWRFL